MRAPPRELLGALRRNLSVSHILRGLSLRRPVGSQAVQRCRHASQRLGPSSRFAVLPLTNRWRRHVRDYLHRHDGDNGALQHSGSEATAAKARKSVLFMSTPAAGLLSSDSCVLAINFPAANPLPFHFNIFRVQLFCRFCIKDASARKHFNLVVACAFRVGRCRQDDCGVL